MSVVAKVTVPGIAKDTGPAHGWTSVGTTEVPLVVDKLGDVLKGTVIVADPDNTAVVYVGKKGVTADKTSTGGFPLEAGKSIPIPLEDPSLIYVISSSASQNVAWISA